MDCIVGVCYCRNLPFNGRAMQDSRVCLPRRKTRESRHQCLFEQNIKKTKEGLRIWRIRVRELFTCGEGISISRVRHKGRQPLIECAKSWLQYYLSSLFMFLYFFGVDKGCCLCSYVFSSVMRNSDLRSSLKARKLCVELILNFWKVCFNQQEWKRPLRLWTLNEFKWFLWIKSSVTCWF